MPKLPSAAASAAKKAAAAGGSTPLEPGNYECRLTNVTAKTASTGNPMWVWELEVTDEKAPGRRLWVNTVLTDSAMWKVGEMFAAFEVDTDADTDELIGEKCMAEVVQRVMTGGARAGQMGNDVRRCYPIGAEDGVGNEEAIAAGVASAPSGAPAESPW